MAFRVFRLFALDANLIGTYWPKSNLFSQLVTIAIWPFLPHTPIMLIHFLHIVRHRILRNRGSFSFRLADQLVEFFLLKNLASTQVDLATGESRYLQNLADTLKLKEGFVVDIAASDGFTQSPTLGFY